MLLRTPLFMLVFLLQLQATKAFSLEASNIQRLGENPNRESWTLMIDNDIFTPGTKDADYTFGMAFIVGGLAPSTNWWTLAPIVNSLDTLFGIDDARFAIVSRSIDFGFFALTPLQTNATEAIQDDRPYASLIFYSTANERVDALRKQAWQTSITVGVIGLPLVGEIQNGLHTLLNTDHVQGWSNQISAGGEPTFRYSMAHQTFLPLNSPHFEMKSTFAGSLGYLTQGSWSLSMRAGALNSPWWAFKPEVSNYGEQSGSSNIETNHAESYFFAGITLKARVYNAFLQGQFRHSEVKYSLDEKRIMIGEAWAGFTFAFKDGFRFSYMARLQSSELRHGQGDRYLLWGGLTFAQVFL
ncbi:Uncharacterised protein [BD1-7 clade bacterium]|uniref:Outer membrane protein n=1 Tax=BD1-7 clade bacterium TaxID=2029982 RepID=A0A5S9N8K3_9GAMM|nr:Uncharacterised protein [BD1-7 clade bacterium]